MKKPVLPSEILCLFFIITVSVLFGKVLTDVKKSFDEELDRLENSNIAVNYQVHSHRANERIETMKDLTVIRNQEDLRYFVEMLKKGNVKVSWLNNKLVGYDKEYFETKTLVVISIVNDDNVSLVRINDIHKDHDKIKIELNKKIKNYEPTSKYTWFAVIEIEDVNSDILLDSVDI